MSSDMVRLGLRLGLPLWARHGRMHSSEKILRIPKNVRSEQIRFSFREKRKGSAKELTERRDVGFLHADEVLSPSKLISFRS